MAKGCDYAWDRPNMDALRAAGITFVCRYLSYDRTGKNLSAREATALQAHGIAVVSNWEWQERDALKGRATGQQYAREADRQHRAYGGPPGAPIYFSIDFDAQAGEMRQVAAYFDGINDVLGRGRTGAYGGFYPLSVLWERGNIKWAWQTTAWSGGRQLAGRNLYQHAYNVRIGGGRVDIDESFGRNYGQWGAPPPGAPETPVEGGNPDLNTPWRLTGEYSATIGSGFDQLLRRTHDLF